MLEENKPKKNEDVFRTPLREIFHGRGKKEKKSVGGRDKQK